MGDGITPARTRAWRRALAGSAATALVALGLGVGVGGCGGSDSAATGAGKAPKHTRTVDPARQAKLMATGARVFAKTCNSCHTLLDRHRTMPTFEIPPPNFNQVRPEYAYVKQRAEGGGIDMASFSGELTPFQISAVATYVSTNAGRDVHDAAADASPDVAAGKQVFAAHCARCHGIAGSRRTGRPTWGGTNFNVVKPGQAWIQHMLRTGVEGAMPKLGKQLSSAQLRAVATYVESVAGENPEVATDR